MNIGATVANALWLAASFQAARRFARVLHQPEEAQRAWLTRQLARHARSEFGREHDFSAIQTPTEFARRVPLSDYESVAPYIPRIQRGELDVLSCGRVTHLAPTSGSSGGARKLIPFSASLQEGFNAAVSAWMIDLVRQRPALVAGPGYWSVSPLADSDDGEESIAPNDARSTVPVGFADDADYLGSGAAWLVRRALAAPSALRHVRDIDAFWSLTALALLRDRDLRLISIWHPSFLDLLLAGAERSWPVLLGAIAEGTCPWLGALPEQHRRGWITAPDRARSDELRCIGAHDCASWWPRLQILSCWGEQAAEHGWRALVQRFPRVLVQAKGLLATEGVITIPLGSARPLAIESHFFEFIDANGDLRFAHQLERGSNYEVVVTNGGGLWRYRLGDMVECAGHVHATPSLRFLGRAGRVSDLRGEKLNEPFVAEVLRALWNESEAPEYAALRAWDAEGRAGYELLVSSDLTDDSLRAADAVPTRDHALAERLEAVLATNPHYALARRLGQLETVRVVRVDRELALADVRVHPGRLGDAKPRVLLSANDRSD